MYTLAVRSAMVAAALFAAQGSAAAQVQDFATCDADLPACTGEINDCCYRPFNPVASSRAVIIPMDRCHQRLAAGGDEGPPSAASPAWCGDPSATADEGMFQAYGLVYRLMQNGINVHWVINPSKDPPRLTAAESAGAQGYSDRDIDLWVLSADGGAPLTAGQSLSACTGPCADPVAKIDPATMDGIADSYNYEQLPLRGGAWVIAPEDRARFDRFMRKTGEFSRLAGNPTYDFSAVDMLEVASGARIVAQDFRSAGPRYALYNGGADAAPVAQRIDFAAPRLARLAPAGASQLVLTLAKLNTPATYPACKSEPFSPSDAVYCDLTPDDIQSGALVDGNFQTAWLDRWRDATPCDSSDETTRVDAVRAFMTAVPGVRQGGSVMFADSVIAVFESPACGRRQPAGALGTGVETSSQAPVEALILRRPGNQFMQWGDLPTRFAAGTAARWRHNGYEPSHAGTGGTLVRLVSEDRSAIGNSRCSFHKSAPGCDVFEGSDTDDEYDAALYLRHLDQSDNGIAFYQGGADLTGKSSHIRLALNSLFVLPAANRWSRLAVREKSRSADIAAVVGGTPLKLRATFGIATTPTRVSTFTGAADAASFSFPHSKGHLRAVRASSLTSSENATVLFDAGGDDAVPAASPTGCTTSFRGSCRTVFTTVAAPEEGLAQRPARVLLTTGNADQLKPLMGPMLSDAAARTLIARVLAGVASGPRSWRGALGGIDRSTPAVIEASPLIPSSSDRPTMIYVGAMDGMLHAICAEAKGPCPAAGRELWAFIPRTQLPMLRLNAARVDGSPKVTDVFGDFDPTDGDVRGEWRTVLTFQTGAGNPGDPARAPSAFALDITDPASPVVLWERTTRSERTSVEQGIGLGVAMGHARVQGVTTGLTFLQTSNGGTGAAGFWLGAVETTTGRLVWDVKELYPAPRSARSAPVPHSGVPGGAVAVGTDATGMVTRVVVPSLHGAMWQYTAATGANPLGAGVPLVKLTSDYLPVGAAPSIYQHTGNGRLYAIAASGGYVDPIAPTWAPAGHVQYLVSAAIETNPAHAPITESESADFADDRGFVQSFGEFSRPTVQTATVSEQVVARADQ